MKKVRTHAPELLEELQGIADGSGVDYRVIAAHELSPYRLQPSYLVMAISGDYTRSKLSVLARNHEWIAEDSRYLTLCHAKPTQKMRSLGFTFHWANMSRYGGVNEAGLAISSTSTSFVNSGPPAERVQKIPIFRVVQQLRSRLMRMQNILNPPGAVSAVYYITALPSLTSLLTMCS